MVEFERRNRAALTGARILHDHGGAFKKDGQFILAERADRVVALPSEQHGELSVLDNLLFAIAMNCTSTNANQTLLICIDQDGNVLWQNQILSSK